MPAQKTFIVILPALLVVLLHGVAFALPRLLVLQAEEQRARPSLVEALRFQLRDLTQVETRPEALAAEPAAARIGHATKIASDAQASFAVWLEAVPELEGEPGFLLYVVGGASGRAVVQVVRLPASQDGPDVDRSLALKVSEIIESALRPGEVQLGSALQPRATPPETRVSVTPLLPRAARPASFDLLLGGLAVSPAGSVNGQIGFRLGVGYAFRTTLLELDWVVTGRLLSPLDIRRDDRRAKLGEQAVAAEFGLRSLGRLAFGGQLGTELRFVHADGFIGNTETSSTLLVLPALRAGPELRAHLSEQATLSLAAGGEWMPLRQRFSLAGAPLADLGQVRGDALFSLIISIR